MNSNLSFSSLRRSAIIDALDKCDSNKTRQDLLIDKIIELENCLAELQEAYCEMMINFRKVHVHEPF